MMTRAALGLLVIPMLAGCGLAGLDGYGRPVGQCPAGAKAVLLDETTGKATCAQTPADVILTGKLPPEHPEVTARLKALSDQTGGPVAYTDGNTTQTYFPNT